MEQTKCHCGDRAASECPGEWEQGCDLGANESHVRVAPKESADALTEAVGVMLRRDARARGVDTA